MIIILKTNVDSDNTINKSFENQTQINIKVTKDFNIISPDLYLTTNSEIEDLNIFNYVEIPELKRSYFINSISNQTGKIWVLSLNCDVIETYKTEILACKAKLTRNIKNGDYLSTTMDMSNISISEKLFSDKELTGKSSVLTSVGA